MADRQDLLVHGNLWPNLDVQGPMLGWRWVLGAVLATFVLGVGGLVWGALYRTYEVTAEASPSDMASPAPRDGQAPDDAASPPVVPTLILPGGGRVTAFPSNADDVDVEVVSMNDDLGVELRIHNRSLRMLSFITPQDGSYYGWVSPSYAIEAYDADDNLLSMPARCGNTFVTLSESTVEMIPPGGVFAVKIPVRTYLPDAVKVRITYAVDPARLAPSGQGAVDSLAIEESPVLRARLGALFTAPVTSPFVLL